MSRKLPLAAGLTSISAILLYAAKQDAPQPTLYLLAATPTAYRAVTYPATLYSIDPQQRLHLHRTVVERGQGVEFVLVGPTFLAIGHPTAATNTLSIVHYDAPMRADSLQFADATAVQANPVLGALLLDTREEAWMVGLSFFKNGAPRLTGIVVNPPGGARKVVDPVEWSEVQNLRFSGSIGGADIGFGSISPTLGPQGLYMYSPQGVVSIARLRVPENSAPEVPATLEAANDQFVIATRNVTDSSSPKARRLWIYDRQSGTAFDLLVEGNSSRYRIFGRWVAVIVSFAGLGPSSASALTEIAPGTYVRGTSEEFDPGEDQQRPGQTADLPPVRSFYQHPVTEQWLPGKLLVINLATRQKFEYETGQADSEILHIDDQRVLFRINDQIYKTQIARTTFGPPTLLVKDVDVPEVHWVFWAAQ